MLPRLASLLLFSLALPQCERSASPEPQEQEPETFFRTEWQTETEYVATRILTDLAEMSWYAARGEKPPRLEVEVETLAANPDRPTLSYRIRLPGVERSGELTFHEPLWSPRAYSGIGRSLSEALGIRPQPAGARGGATFLDPLARDFGTLAIEAANERVSRDLQSDFRSPQVHAEAAVVLGALAIYDSSGDFGQLRFLLNRATAHLAFAEALDQAALDLPMFRLGDALAAAASNQQTRALELADSLPAGMATWTRAIRTEVTGDWRILEQQPDLTRLEKFVLFRALAGSIDEIMAVARLPEPEFGEGPEWNRILNAGTPGVEIGNELLDSNLPKERLALAAWYEKRFGAAPGDRERQEFLRRVPGGSFLVGKGAEAVPGLLSDGIWADHFQRHLAHAVAANYAHLDRMLADPEAAAEYRQAVLPEIEALELAPFLEARMATDEAQYLPAADAMHDRVRQAPERIPAGAWAEMNRVPRYRDALYLPAGDHPHLNEWHSANPPPGTAYQFARRQEFASLQARPDLARKLEELHGIAPYDTALAARYSESQENENGPDFARIREAYSSVLAFNPEARQKVAGYAESDAQWFELMEQAAVMLPRLHYPIAHRRVARGERQEAAEHYEKAMRQWPDSVQMANEALWLVHYYADESDFGRARELASVASEVYAENGLFADATLAERVGEFDRAEELYEAILKRYRNPLPLRAFYYRHRARGGDIPRRAAGLYDHVREHFPDGLQEVTPEALGGNPPARGVRVVGENWFTRNVGLAPDAIIVALDGIRTESVDQYAFVRELRWTPEMEFIVWQDGRYETLQATLPDRRFEVPVEDYPLP